MKMIDDSVIQSVVTTLKDQRLFRYDCDTAEQSATARLEKSFAELVGANYAVAMSSCSSALFTSLLAAGVEQGDEVLLPAFTFIAVPSSIVHAGAIPRLVDVTEDYYIDLEKLEAAMTDKTTALMLSYMRGRCPDVEAVKALCDAKGVILIEDSAHSLGVLFNGKQTGLFGVAGAYSAQSYKMLDGGEGGIMVTNDEDMAFRAMLYAGCYERNYTKHYWTDDVAEKLDALVNSLPVYNFRMSNLSAAALIPQLGQVDDRAEHFNRNFYRLCDILDSCKKVRVPKFAEGVRPAADSIQWEFVGMSEEQISATVRDLGEHGLKVRVFAGGNARCFWNWTFFDRKDECAYTRDLLQRTADLRLHLCLEPEDIDNIGKMLLAAIERNT